MLNPESDLFVWEDPPGDGRHRPRRTVLHEQIATQLRMHPGRWARPLGLHGNGHVNAIKTGRVPAYRPAGTFEAIQRGGHIYVRYISQETT